MLSDCTTFPCLPDSFTVAVGLAGLLRDFTQEGSKSRRWKKREDEWEDEHRSDSQCIISKIHSFFNFIKEVVCATLPETAKLRWAYLQLPTSERGPMQNTKYFAKTHLFDYCFGYLLQYFKCDVT